MNMMSHDFRPERERKPLEDLIRQALSAYVDQAAGDDDKAETVRAFMIENDLADYRDVTDAAFDQILLRANLPWLIADMAARVNTLVEFVGAECFDQIDDRTTSKSDKLSVLLGEAHNAVTRFSKPEGMNELFNVLATFKADGAASSI